MDPAHYTLNGGAIYNGTPRSLPFNQGNNAQNANQQNNDAQNPDNNNQQNNVIDLNKHDFGNSNRFLILCVHNEMPTSPIPSQYEQHPQDQIHLEGVYKIIVDMTDARGDMTRRLPSLMQFLKPGGTLVIPNCLFVAEVSATYCHLLRLIAKKNGIASSEVGTFAEYVNGQKIEYQVYALWGDKRASVLMEGQSVITNTILIVRNDTEDMDHTVLPENKIAILCQSLNQKTENGRTVFENGLPQAIRNTLGNAQITVKSSLSLQGEYSFIPAAISGMGIVINK